MEQNLVEVEILTQTITAQYGALSTGDTLRTSPEFARHLVEDAGAAKYVQAAKAEAVKADEASKAVAGDPKAEAAKASKAKAK